MTEPELPPDSDEAWTEPLQGPPPWVKVVAAITAVLLLLFAILVLTGGPGAHGPGRHSVGTPAAEVGARQ